MNPTDYLQQVKREKANAKRAKTVARKRARREKAARTWPTSIPHLARALCETTGIAKGPISWVAQGSQSQPYVTMHLRPRPRLVVGGRYRKQSLQAIHALISHVAGWRFSIDEVEAKRRGDDLRFFPTKLEYHERLWTQLGLGAPYTFVRFPPVLTRLCHECGACAAGQVWDADADSFFVACHACQGMFESAVHRDAVLAHVHERILGKESGQ